MNTSTTEIRRIFKSTRNNSKARRIENALTFAELEELWRESDGRCAISGIEFDLTPFTGKRRPFAASIDRIDPAIGYRKSNCRLVCVAVNYAMSDWGLAVLKRIAAAILERDPGDNIPGGKGFRGVNTRSERGRTVFEATISTPRGRVYLGRFPTGWDAHVAYRAAQQRLKDGLPVLKRREVHQDSQRRTDEPAQVLVSD